VSEENKPGVSKAKWGPIAIAFAITFAAGTFGSLSSPSFQVFFIHFVGFAALLGAVPFIGQMTTKEASGWNGFVLVVIGIMIIGAFSVLLDGIQKATALGPSSTGEAKR
jgi:hypothetical protein